MADYAAWKKHRRRLSALDGSHQGPDPDDWADSDDTAANLLEWAATLLASQAGVPAELPPHGVLVIEEGASIGDEAATILDEDHLTKAERTQALRQVLAKTCSDRGVVVEGDIMLMGDDELGLLAYDKLELVVWMI